MAGYLKALAVFRLVSEQSDAQARGWWRENTFCLESRLDEAQLAIFSSMNIDLLQLLRPGTVAAGLAKATAATVLTRFLEPQTNGLRTTSRRSVKSFRGRSSPAAR